MGPQESSSGQVEQTLGASQPKEAEGEAPSWDLGHAGQQTAVTAQMGGGPRGIPLERRRKAPPPEVGPMEGALSSSSSPCKRNRKGRRKVHRPAAAADAAESAAVAAARAAAVADPPPRLERENK